MSQSVVSPAVVYPCSDGQPMGESDLHIMCMLHVLEVLKRHFEIRAQADVYVSANFLADIAYAWLDPRIQYK